MGNRPKRAKTPSMNDVAALAGVSQTTVSFVVNNVADANIPQETHERVWAAVRELGYRPNALARGLRSQRTHTIGFISDEIATTPFAGQMIQGAQTRAWDEKYLILLINTDGVPTMRDAAVNALLERQVEGIIYATMWHRQVSPPPEIKEVPTVLLDCFVADRSLPSIVPDEVRGGREATTFLLQKGHRRIGFVSDFDPVPAQRGRLQGYREALASFDISFDEALMRTGPSTPAGGYDCAMQMLKLQTPPTAFFCFNDRMAMGVYDAIRKLDLRIPDDVAVVGYDNHEIIAAHLYPPLTTMQLPHYEMGRWAVEHLLTLINESGQHSQGAVIQELIACPLVVRTSA